MSSLDILQLQWPLVPQSEQWLLCDNTGEWRPATELLQSGASYQLIIPAQSVLYQHVVLPAKTQRQAMQALPFMVEEQLAADLESVHIAVGRRLASGAWPVLVISRELLEKILALFRRNGAFLHAVYVDAQMAEPAGNRLCLHLQQQQVLVAGLGLATALSLDECSLLPLLLDGKTPDGVTVSGAEVSEQYALLATQWQTEFEASGVPVEREPEVVLAVSANSINLLQGAYSPQLPKAGVSWLLTTAVLLVAVWLTQWSWQFGSALHLERRAGQYNVLAEQHYRELFPQATQASEPRRRVESFLLGQQSAAVGGQSFSSLLGAAMQVYQSQPEYRQINFQQLRFDAKRGQLEFELSAGNIEQLDAYKQALGKAGVQSRMGSVSDSEQGVTGRIQITGVQ